MLLEELKPGLRINGLIPAEVITVIYAQWHGTDALELTYKTASGQVDQQVVFRNDQDKLPRGRDFARQRWPFGRFHLTRAGGFVA